MLVKGARGIGRVILRYFGLSTKWVNLQNSTTPGTKAVSAERLSDYRYKVVLVIILTNGEYDVFIGIKWIILWLR